MFGNRINYKKHGWKLIDPDQADITYRSHYYGLQCLCPNCWLRADAVNDDGRRGYIWWYSTKIDRDDVDGGDLVRDWSKCNDIEVVDD